MIALSGLSETRWDEDAFVARITTHSDRPEVLRESEVLALKNGSDKAPDLTGFKGLLTCGEWDCGTPLRSESELPAVPRIVIPERLAHLEDGDIIEVAPRTGRISVLFRKASTSNTILFTEACNNYCLMCAQPPINSRPYCSFDTWKKAIPLVPKDTLELGISGGEPTLFPDELLAMVRTCRNHLPNTALHLLTNGRMFAYLSYAEALAAIHHPDLMLGVPLYSDLDYEHDHIVQSQSAFEQAIKGILNLARVGIRVEIRIVVHRLNVGRLASLAEFICRNLPFAEHVALMGLEPVGFAKLHIADLWMDPFDYKDTLTQAVQVLTRNRMNVSVFNHQLCTIDRDIWRFARRSISDWKLEYLSECDSCTVRRQCCGFFSSSIQTHSSHIQGI